MTKNDNNINDIKHKHIVTNLLTFGGVLSMMTPLVSKVAINPAPLTTPSLTMYLAPTLNDSFSSLWSFTVGSGRFNQVPFITAHMTWDRK